MEKHILKLTMIGMTILLLLSLFPTQAVCGTGVFRERFFQPGEDLVTPHIPWANNWKQGKIRVLFIVPKGGMREVVELSQRMDIEYRVFGTAKENLISREPGLGFVPGEGLEDQLNFLKQLLKQNFDVIAIGAVPWDILPLEIKHTILKKVKEGTGLVGIIPKQDKYLEAVLKMGIPAEDRESLLSSLRSFPFPFGVQQYLSDEPKYNDVSAFLEDTAATVLFGKGRVCIFKYPSGVAGPLKLGSFHPFVPGINPKEDSYYVNLNDYDYQLAFVIRTILWASRKEPPVSVKTVLPFAVIKQDSVTSSKSEFIISCSDLAAGSLSANFFLKDNNGDTVYEMSSHISSKIGETAINFPLPCLPVGRYRSNLIISDAKGHSVNFASSVIEVIGETFIEEIVLTQNSFKIDEPVRGTVKIHNIEDGQKIRIQRFDNYKSLLTDEIYSADRDSVDFELQPAQEVLTIINRLQISLMKQDGEVIDTRRKIYSISNFYPTKDEMRVVLWNELPQKTGAFFTAYVLNHFREKGIDTHYVNFLKWVPMSNLWHIPYYTRIIDIGSDGYHGGIRAKEDHVRRPCLTDPEYIEKHKILLEGIEKLRDYSVSDISMGDECMLVEGEYELCFSPTCTASFRTFVKNKYGTVEKMNAEYDTEYNAFDELEQIPVDEARQKGQVSRWVDQRLHMDTVWSGIFGFSREVIQGKIPGSRTGYEGSDFSASTWRADDYWKLSQSMNMNNIYYKHFQAVAWRSFLPDDALLGLGWFGGCSVPHNDVRYYRHETFFPSSEYMPWASLFKGANSLWIHHVNPGGYSVAAPDWSFFTFFESSLAKMREIKEGIDKTLLRSKRITDVGIFYSSSSIHTATFLKENMDPRFQSITGLLVDIGFQPKVFSYSQVVAGKLKEEKIPVLFLIGAYSLSLDEVAMLKEYVYAGGTLIADIRPGIRNPQGKILPFGALDEIFGVKFNETQPFLRSSAFRIKSEVFDLGQEVLYDSGISVTAGTTDALIADTPVLIFNSFGKGKSLLLNFALSSYSSGTRITEPWANGRQFRILMQNALNKLGINTYLKINEELPNAEITRFQSGNIQYVTVFQDVFDNKSPEEIGTKKVTIEFPYATYIYDVRQRQFMGNSKNTTVEITPLEPLILALVPYRIDSVEIQIAEKTVTAGEAVDYSIEILPHASKTEEQIVRIQFLNPSGEEIVHYRKKIAVRGKSLQRHFTALNDESGEWTVIATDIISGRQASVVFSVKGR